MPTFSSFGDQAKIRWQRTTIGGFSGLWIGKGPWKIIRRQTRTIKHIAVIVWAVFNCKRRCKCLHLFFGKIWPAFVSKIAEGHIFHAVAIRANFFVNFITTLHLSAVKLTKGSFKRKRNVLSFFCTLIGESKTSEGNKASDQECCKFFHRLLQITQQASKQVFVSPEHCPISKQEVHVVFQEDQAAAKLQ